MNEALQPIVKAEMHGKIDLNDLCGGKCFSLGGEFDYFQK